MENTLFFYLDRSLERWGGRLNNGQSCEKAKAKPAAKMENRKMCWGAKMCWQRIDRQLSNYNLRRLLCPKSGRQREAPPILVAFIKEFFLSWPEWFSFFLLWTCFPFFSFFFFTKTFLLLLLFLRANNFSMSKELPRVNFVKCAR